SGDAGAPPAHPRPPTAADIEDIDSAFKLIGEAVGKRQDMIRECGHHRLSALFGHDLVEAVKCFVSDATTGTEALDNFVFDAAKHGDPLHGRRKVYRNRCSRD